MVTYYTALGRFATKIENGTRLPMVILDNEEYHLGLDETIIWGSLHWNFFEKTALEKEYIHKKEESHVFNDASFENTLARLETRGLVISASNYIAADALYDLIGSLIIRPIEYRFFDKCKSCAYMYFVKGVPLKCSIKMFFGDDLSKNEQDILRLARHVGITAAEIIQCGEKNIKDIRNSDELMEKLYSDPKTTDNTINTQSRFSKLHTDVLTGVSGLYLKKKIIFER